jgi:ATP-binding cassette, subfamily B, bacterial HlyB/CyaB
MYMFGFNAGRLVDSQPQPSRLTTKQFIWLIDSLCRVHRRPFDAVRLVQRFPPPHLRAALVEAVRAHGFESRELSLAELRPEALPLPAIAFLRPDVAHGAPAVQTAPIPGLIAKCEGGRVLHVEACTDLPRTRFTRNFEEFFEPTVILAVPERHASL